MYSRLPQKNAFSPNIFHTHTHIHTEIAVKKILAAGLSILIFFVSPKEMHGIERIITP